MMMQSPPLRRTREVSFVAPLLCLLGIGFSGCALLHTQVNPDLSNLANASPLQISDALETLIEKGKDTGADRDFAWSRVKALPAVSAEDLFARAAVGGRVVQSKGLLAASLLPEIEEDARNSRSLDPDFRNGAATRLLGSLYVMAPAKFLRHGNSENGIDLLEELATKHPEVPENQLRLAEAYVALSDSESATPHLCRCLTQKSQLRLDDQQLLDHLVEEIGRLNCTAP